MHGGNGSYSLPLIWVCLHYAETKEDEIEEKCSSVSAGLIMGCIFIEYWLMIVTIMSAMEFFDDKNGFIRGKLDF